jgi:hypothetical protein
MLVEIGLVLHFCQPGHLLTCSNFSSYVAIVAMKEYKPLNLSHNITEARIRCFSHLHADLFPLFLLASNKPVIMLQTKQDKAYSVWL